MRYCQLSISVFSLLLVGACTQSSGVMQLAPNTYSIVTSDEIGGTIGAKKAGLQQAAAHCASAGLQMVTMQSQSAVRDDFMGDAIGHHDLTFRCVPKGSASAPILGGHQAALIVR